MMWTLIAAAASALIAPPAALTLDRVPPVPAALREATQPYLEYRSAAVVDWNPRTHGLLIATRFGNSTQLHEVARPGGARVQVSFEDEPVASGQFAPHGGDTLVVSKDAGGGEFFQLYTLANGHLTLLTDGRSRNEAGTWDREGRTFGYTSTRRNGTDSDIYLIDPRDPKSDHMVAKLAGNGWAVTGFAPGGKTALVEQRHSIASSDLFLMDTASGALTRLTPEAPATAPVSYDNPRFGPDGQVYATSDVGSDFQRLGRIGRDGRFTPLTPGVRGDVERFEVS